MAEFERAYAMAVGAYLDTDASVPLQEMNPGSLDAAQAFCADVPMARAQELCGWANVEMLFTHYRGVKNIPKDEVYERAIQAFGRSYDLYEKDGDTVALRKLEIAHAAMPLYWAYANNDPVSADQRDDAMRSIAAVGSRLVEMTQEDRQLLHDEQTIARCAETITILGLSLKRGDTRKPVDTLVVPSTMRQGFEEPSRHRQRKPRAFERWDVTKLGYNNAQGWSVNSKLSLETGLLESEQAQIAADVHLVSPNLHLTDGVNDIIFTIRSLVSSYEGTATEVEKTVAKNIGTRLLRMSRGVK